MFFKLKDNKIVSGFIQHNILFYFILMVTCFGHLTYIRPSLQNLVYAWGT